MTAWTTHAWERAAYLTETIQKEQTRHRRKGDALRFERWLMELDDLKGELRDRHGPFDSLTGGAIEKTWSELHRIEVGLDEYYPTNRLMEVTKEKVREQLPKERVDEILRELKKPWLSRRTRRAMALHAIQEAHYASMQRHDSERNWQRGIVRIATGALLLAVAMVLIQAFFAAHLRIIPAPKKTPLPPWSLLVLVMLMGLLGGALGALLSQYQIYGKRQISNTLWFNPMPALSMAKLALGLWMAFFGVLLIGTGRVVGSNSSVATLLLMAFVFGFGQQAVTRFLDRRVGDLLEGKPT